MKTPGTEAWRLTPAAVLDGAAVFEADDDAAATAIINADPAVTSKVFQFELKRWKPNPWEEISQKRAARGE